MPETTTASTLESNGTSVMAPVETKAVEHGTLSVSVKAIGPEGSGQLEYVVNSGQLDRDGEILDIASLDLTQFIEKPVIALNHDYQSLPIGKALKIWKEANAKGELELKALAQFAVNEYEVAMIVYRLAKGGYMPAASIGFMTNEIVDNGNGTYTHKNAKMLEFSVVMIGADPKAGAIYKGLKSDLTRLKQIMVDKAAIPYSVHPNPKMADKGATWDAGAVLRQVSGEKQLRTIHAWVDSEGDPEAKSSYKLPHHDADGNTVWNGVKAAMGAILGARGGTSIPEDELRGAYNHIAKHYADFEETPPAFKKYTKVELRKMFGDDLELAGDDLILMLDKATAGIKKFNERVKGVPFKEQEVALTKFYDLSKLLSQVAEKLNANLRIRKRRVIKVNLKRVRKIVKLKVKE